MKLNFAIYYFFMERLDIDLYGELALHCRPGSLSFLLFTPPKDKA